MKHPSFRVFSSSRLLSRCPSSSTALLLLPPLNVRNSHSLALPGLVLLIGSLWLVLWLQARRASPSVWPPRVLRGFQQTLSHASLASALSSNQHPATQFERDSSASASGRGCRICLHALLAWSACCLIDRIVRALLSSDRFCLCDSRLVTCA